MQRTTKHNLPLILLINAAVFIAFIALLESAVLTFLWFPKLTGILPDSLRYYPVKIYTDLDRTVTREFAAWDPELTYTLKPSIDVEHENREFSVRIRTNSAGLRDNEESLVDPAIIALGDSFTMGFGVEQDDSFPELIESRTGLKTLNAGIESYGTARETIMLKRLDRDQLSYLIVQYCPNDLNENAAFISNDGHLETLDRESFISSYESYRASTEYYLGKYLFYLARNLSRTDADLQTAAEKAHQNFLHAKGFLESLEKLSIDAHDVQVIAFALVDVNSNKLLKYEAGFDNGLFMENLRLLMRDKYYPRFIQEMRVIDAIGALNRSDHYILDGHLNAKGHRKVADLLIAQIAK